MKVVIYLHQSHLHMVYEQNDICIKEEEGEGFCRVHHVRKDCVQTKNQQPFCKVQNETV